MTSFASKYTRKPGGVIRLEKYVQDIRLKQWCELIEAANSSGQPRKEWLQENGISKDTFYYWQRKVRRYYAEQNGLVPAVANTDKVSLVEVPMARPATGMAVTAAAVIRIGSIAVEISPNASAEFMERLGRMIRNAL